MPRLATTVDASVEAEFLIRAAQANLNKHALLREVVYAYLLKPREYPSLLPNDRNATSEHLSVRLPMFMADEVRQRAAHKGMSASRWKACLIQAHLMRSPPLDEKEIEAVRNSNHELRAIGRNLNQIARALNTRPHETDRVRLETIQALADMIDGHVETMSTLVNHSQNYWSVE